MHKKPARNCMGAFDCIANGKQIENSKTCYVTSPHVTVRYKPHVTLREQSEIVQRKERAKY